MAKRLLPHLNQRFRVTKFATNGPGTTIVCPLTALSNTSRPLSIILTSLCVIFLSLAGRSDTPAVLRPSSPLRIIVLLDPIQQSSTNLLAPNANLAPLAGPSLPILSPSTSRSLLSKSLTSVNRSLFAYPVWMPCSISSVKRASTVISSRQTSAELTTSCESTHRTIIFWATSTVIPSIST